MTFRRILILFLFSVAFTVTAEAQIVINGTISDAETGETLPSTNILVEGTYRGTITNENGAYTLSIPDSLLPASVLVRYIGYQSETRQISSSSQPQQDFTLTPAVTELEEITVTDENPAVRIMREVIKRKQQWRKKLESYRAEAYTRQTLANDTSIVSIMESTSEVFWNQEQGHREVIKAQRQTANIEAGSNFAGVSYLPNFYDDDITIAGFDLVGVTHPDALSYYDFTLEGQTSLNEKTVYEIKVIPDRNLQPLFKGTVFVLGEAYALLEVDLQPNEVVTFPPPIRSFTTSYKQQFNNFGKDYWLPVDMRIEGDIKVSMVGLNFPMINFKQTSRITGYRVNVPLPDSLYREDELLAVDTTAAASDSLISIQQHSIPLSVDEQEAYASIDSSATLEEAFKPTGFLARFIDEEDESISTGGRTGLGHIPGSFSPSARYNRVDELFAGLQYTLEPVRHLELRGNGGYSTGYGEWSYGGGIGLQWLNQGSLTSSLDIEYQAETATRYTSHIYTPYLTILPNLLGNPNYFDFYRSEGYQISSQWNLPSRDLSFTIGFNSEDHSSLMTASAYDLLGISDNERINPPIEEGHLQFVDIVAGYNMDEGFNFGVSGQRYIRLNIEHSSHRLGSDFNYTRYESRLSWSFPTFYKRRLMPNTLDVGLKAGTFSGNLPMQKPGIIDGALGILSPYGILRALRNHPYEGEQYLALHMEHNFRTIPFEAAGLKPLVERNIGLILFGGAAKTWGASNFSPALGSGNSFQAYGTNGIHWEAGASLNGILGLFRLDVATRLDEPAILVNIGLARFF